MSTNDSRANRSKWLAIHSCKLWLCKTSIFRQLEPNQHNQGHFGGGIHSLELKWVSEQILNGTSAQSSYTVPFTSVHAGKYRTEDKPKTDTTETEHNPEKANNTKLAWFSGLVASYDTRPGNEVDLFYNTPEPTWGRGSNKPEILGFNYSWCILFFLSCIQFVYFDVYCFVCPYQSAKQNYPGSVACYDTTLGQKARWVCSTMLSSTNGATRSFSVIIS